MLADVRGHQPAEAVLVRRRLEAGRRPSAGGGCRQRRRRRPVAGSLLDEGDVAPRVGAQAARVVVGLAGEPADVLGHAVPLLARHLARLAADADAGVGEEADSLARLVAVARGPGGSSTVAVAPPPRARGSRDRASSAAARPPPGPDVAGGGLDLLDVHVGVERDRTAARWRSPPVDQPRPPPVVGQADLVDHAPLYARAARSAR